MNAIKAFFASEKPALLLIAGAAWNAVKDGLQAGHVNWNSVLVSVIVAIAAVVQSPAKAQ